MNLPGYDAWKLREPDYWDCEDEDREDEDYADFLYEEWRERQDEEQREALSWRDNVEAMEGRLMQRITGLQEQMVERFTLVGFTLKSMNTTLKLITSLLTSFDRRITDLERK